MFEWESFLSVKRELIGCQGKTPLCGSQSYCECASVVPRCRQDPLAPNRQPIPQWRCWLRVAMPPDYWPEAAELCWWLCWWPGPARGHRSPYDLHHPAAFDTAPIELESLFSCLHRRRYAFLVVFVAVVFWECTPLGPSPPKDSVYLWAHTGAHLGSGLRSFYTLIFLSLSYCCLR